MNTIISSPPQRVAAAVTGTRAATSAHYASLLTGFAVLLVLGRGQWFFFDEWDIIWQPEAVRRFVEGHNGHWSSIPIAIWSAIQHTLGLGSYLPYLLVAIVAHLIVAHLLWRLLRRVGSSAWIATWLTAVFVFFGAAAENLLWAFQLGFVGAIGFGLAAVLVAARPVLMPWSIVSIAVLLTLGAATAGTALPFFVTVGLIVLTRFGWVQALLAVGPPAAVYLIWFTLIAGPNPTSIYRARGVGNTLQGIPEFVATMFVDGYSTTTPVPGFGLVIVIAIVLWTIWAVGRRKSTFEHLVVVSMLAAGIIFATLTAYSRLELGTASSTGSRYIYMVVVTTLPCVALLLTRLAATARLRQIVVIALIGVVLVFNTGLLANSAGGTSAIEVRTHELISASLDIADAHPGEVDPESLPDPVYLPRTVAQLQVLEHEFGLTRVPYDEEDRLSAIANISLSVEGASGSKGSDSCETLLLPGTEFDVAPSGTIVRAVDGAELTIAPASGEIRGTGNPLTLGIGDSVLTILEPTTFVVESSSAPVSICPQ